MKNYCATSLLVSYLKVYLTINAKYSNINFCVKLTSVKENKRISDYWRRIQKSLHSNSPSPYNKRSRARNLPLERVLHGAKPRIPDINVKFAFRLSTSSILSSHSSPLLPFIAEGETVSFAIPRRNCIFPFLSLSIRSIPPLFSVFSDLLCLNYPLLSSFVFTPPRNFNSSLSRAHLYI